MNRRDPDQRPGRATVHPRPGMARLRADALLTLLLCAVLGGFLLVGCKSGGGENEPAGGQTAEADPSGDEEPQKENADKKGKQGEGDDNSEGKASSDGEPEPADSEPEPEPEPEPLKAPDGTEIVPCEEPPEGMACVPGGPFIRGFDDDPHTECEQPSYNKRHVANTNPAETVWLQTYYIDKTEVTYGAYTACEESGECDEAEPLYLDFDREEQPMTGMSWYDAVKFCKAQGKHLVTEAQWEKAARGPDGELYPWGNEPEPNCEIAVIKDAEGRRSCGVEKRGNKPEKGRALKVCSRPAGRYGLCDMVGNAEEWVADWYSHSWEACGEACDGTDPLGPCDGAEECDGHRYKVVRGGSWYWPASHATGIHRRSHVPSNDPYHHYGFRCAASVEEARAINQAAKDGQPADGDSSPDSMEGTGEEPDSREP